MSEYEKKILLRKDEFECLKSHKYCQGETVNQVNYYYDTDGFDYDYKKITCRIREKQGVYIATVKEHGLFGDDCSMERSRVVKDEHDDILFEGMGVSVQGILKTERITTEPVKGVKVMLDYNVYLDTEDFELEIEYDPEKQREAFEVIHILVKHLGYDIESYEAKFFVDRIGAAPNKSHRFFSHLSELKAIRR